MFRIVIALLAFTSCAALLFSCSPVKLLNFTVPSGGYSVRKDIAYGEDARQKLDVYIPDGLSGPVPVILFFYGGSWQSGSKDDYRFAGQAFASKGYIAVVADYRLYPQVSFPVFLQDSASALRWTRDNITPMGGDASQIFLAGHSAGAYLAVMLAADTSYIKAAGVKPSEVRGVIGIAGPYDFLPFTDPAIIALFSTAPGPDTQPINYVHANMPPMFLATGDADTTVMPRNTHHLEDKLKRFGDSVETHYYPGVAHIGIALSLARGFRGKAPLLDDISRFVDSRAAQKP